MRKGLERSISVSTHIIQNMCTFMLQKLKTCNNINYCIEQSLCPCKYYLSLFLKHYIIITLSFSWIVFQETD